MPRARRLLLVALVGAAAAVLWVWGEADRGRDGASHEPGTVADAPEDMSRSGPTLSGSGAARHAPGDSNLGVVLVAASDERPLAGVEASIWVRDPARGRDLEGVKATTDAAGRIELGSYPEGVLRVGGFVRGYLLAEDVETRPDARGRRTAVLSFDRGLRVTGRVRNRDGTTPTSVMLRLEQKGFLPKNEVPGADGSFVFAPLEPGPVTLFAGAMAAGGWTSARVVVQAGTENIELVMDAARPGDVVPLLVRLDHEDGLPVTTTVRVELSTVEGSSQGHFVPVNAGEGTLLTALPVPGSVRVHVDPDLGGRWGHTVLRMSEPPVVQGTLRRDWSIAGRVVDAKGRGVEGIAVHAASRFAERGEGPAGVAITDDEGRFELGDLGEDTYRVRARVRAPWIAPSFVEVGRASAPVEIVLTEAPLQRARVVGPDGRPVVGARVVVFPREDGSAPYASATSDADGFVDLHMDAERPGPPLAVEPAEGDEDLLPRFVDSWYSERPPELRLLRSTWTRGRVVDADDGPVEGAEVHARLETDQLGAWCLPVWRGEGWVWSAPSTRADARGRFALRTPVDRSLVLSTGNAQETTASGAQDVVLRIARDVEVQVALDPWHDEDRGSLLLVSVVEGACSTPHVHLDAAGTGTLRGVRSGSILDFWSADLGEDRYVYARKVRVEEERLVLPVGQGQRITGRLRLANADPVPAAVYMYAFSPRTFRRMGPDNTFLGLLTVERAEGSDVFAIRGVPPGNFDLWVTAGDDARSWTAETTFSADARELDVLLREDE
ncbi:MAG: carboxypeptidase-like regulatory domain-containing protein [Planctomycetota bacterium]